MYQLIQKTDINNQNTISIRLNSDLANKIATHLLSIKCSFKFTAPATIEVDYWSWDFLEKELDKIGVEYKWGDSIVEQLAF